MFHEDKLSFCAYWFGFDFLCYANKGTTFSKRIWYKFQEIAAYICVVRILHVVEILNNIYFPDERDERSESDIFKTHWERPNRLRDASVNFMEKFSVICYMNDRKFSLSANML